MQAIKNDVIAYNVCRVANGGCYISVQNGEVQVQAPWYITREKIQTLVEEKAKWISEKLREYENENIKKRNYISGKKIKILGDYFNLVIIYENIKLPKLVVEEKIVKITIPNKYKRLDVSDIIGILIEKMYERIAIKEIEDAMEKTRIMLGIAPEDYEIKRIKHTLGKCSNNKKIMINPDIVMFSKEIIDYIVLHEFCHLKYKTHARKFYQMLEKYMPNYTEYENIIGNFNY